MKHTPKAIEVLVGTANATAADLAINGRPCMVANTGAQPLHINPAAIATTANGFLVPAGTVLNVKFTVNGNLSIISNATTTTYAVMIFDL